MNSRYAIAAWLECFPEKPNTVTVTAMSTTSAQLLIMDGKANIVEWIG